MQFTYSAYENLLKAIKENGYTFCDYHDYQAADKAVILRHDIDFYLEYAVRFAAIEQECGARAVYFVQISNPFYNIFSVKNDGILKYILQCGHTIGLHFDRTRYGEDFTIKNPAYIQKIKTEIDILEKALNIQVTSISMHQPTADELNCNIMLEGIKNAYSREFFSEFKYYSDSVMRWREDVMAGLLSGEHRRLQILTHPFWYAEQEKDVKTMLKRFIHSGDEERYRTLEKICGYFDDYLSEDDLVKG